LGEPWTGSSPSTGTSTRTCRWSGPSCPSGIRWGLSLIAQSAGAAMVVLGPHRRRNMPGARLGPSARRCCARALPGRVVGRDDGSPLDPAGQSESLPLAERHWVIVVESVVLTLLGAAGPVANVTVPGSNPAGAPLPGPACHGVARGRPTGDGASRSGLRLAPTDSACLRRRPGDRLHAAVRDRRHRCREATSPRLWGSTIRAPCCTVLSRCWGSPSECGWQARSSRAGGGPGDEPLTGWRWRGSRLPARRCPVRRRRCAGP
jgi:hypothetical protein